MNIFLLSNYSIGCVPYYVKRALIKMGHNVSAFSPDYDQEGWKHCDVNIDVDDLVKKSSDKVDLLLFVEASTGTKFFPTGLQYVPVPTVWWGIDNHLNYRWHKEYANLFDVAFFTQKEYLIKARKYGTKNILWLPLACDEEIHRDRNVKRIYDVSFVGNLTQSRKKFFQSIGFPINLVSGVYLEELGLIYSQSKIVLNICAREELNMRFFEAMCAGALLVTQKIDAGVNDLFQAGKHFVFHNISDASEVIKYYLENDDERIKIAEEGKREVLAKHTYIKRMEEMLFQIPSRDEIFDLRKLKFSSYKVFVQESLVYRHRSFKLMEKSKKSMAEAFRKNRILPILYIIRFSFYRLLERIEKLFLKNF